MHGSGVLSVGVERRACTDPGLLWAYLALRVIKHIEFHSIDLAIMVNNERQEMRYLHEVRYKNRASCGIRSKA
jgi:hypothetical protein